MESWYVRDGTTRRVTPYTHEFRAHAKKRWCNRTIHDVLVTEMRLEPQYVAQAAKSGALTINGKPADPEHALRDGDELVHVVTRVEPDVPDADIPVLYADENLVVVAKPAGVPVHHAGRFRRNTLVEILRAEHPELQLEAASRRGGLHVVHRLDRHVSGTLLLPRNARAASVLNSAIRANALRKVYLARVAGRLAGGEAAAPRLVDAPIRVVSSDGETVADLHADGKPAATRVRSLGYDAPSDTSLALCEPVTGRMHQVRLHLHHLGHPIANDTLYAPSSRRSTTVHAPDARTEANGQSVADHVWLHAWSYSCDVDGLAFSACAPPPDWTLPFAPLPDCRELRAADRP